MYKYPIELQDEEKACGAYCILMILKYHGFKEEIKRIKKKARLNQNGISIKGMIECLKSYQIEAKAYQASLEDIQNHVECPCILYMVYNGIGHFVVLYEMKDDEYIIGDPAKGIQTLYKEEVEEYYGMSVIAIQHVGRVPDSTYKSYFAFLKDTFVDYNKQMISLMMKGLWISLLGYLSSYFFQFFIDDIHQDTKFFYMIVLCLGYGLTELIKVNMERKKNKEMIMLTKALNEDYVFQSSMNMLTLPLSFFDMDKGYIQSQLLSLFDLSEMSIEYFGRLFLDGLSLLVFLLGMFMIDFTMTCLVFIMFISISLFSYTRLQTLQDLHKNYLEAYFVYQHHLLELIENQFLIKRFSLLQRQKERSFSVFLDEETPKEKESIMMNQMKAYIQYMIIMFYIVIMILGFYYFQQQLITLGRFMMFYMLVSYCVDPLIHIISLSAQYKQMSLIYEKYKIFEKDEIIKKEDIHDKVTRIIFDHVSYAYGYQLPLFEHVDFTIDHHMWIKGETGSGKSTLLKLLMGYDLQYTGDIYINDQELRTIELSFLYQHIGYTNETPSFLHLTLRENYLCLEDQKIKAYLKAFGQEHLLEMNHILLQEDGSPLSKGQRQVVALVRLLCQDYDVLILDEAFSHMDSKLAAKIMRYLMKNDEGKIYIMVNHQTKLVNKDVGCAIIEKGRLKIER